jgi:NodT family efflux transporter outer membrane factor (OMF) lipoprotein
MSGAKWLMLTVLSLIASCTVGPNYVRPTAPVPKAYAQKPTPDQRWVAHQDIPAQWWSLFHSKPLNDLITASFQHNSSVTAAQASLHSALEAIAVQQGALFPLVGASFAPSKQQLANILTSILASNEYNYALFTGAFYVSYTPDVFGGIQRQVESLRAMAAYQQLQLEATYITLASNVVNTAIQEASLRGQIVATKQMIANQTKILAIMRQQQQLGDAAKADLALQEAALAATTATLPPLQLQLELQRHLLKALVGRLPDDTHTPTFELSSLRLPAALPLSLPSTLLEHRPDIRAAEEQMHAANALIGTSIANRLPNFNIGMSALGTTASSIQSLLQPDSLFWGLAGLITQPILDGGTLMHKQRLAESIYQETAAKYRATVINAFQNVADTLSAIHHDSASLQAATHAEQAAKTSLNISRQQFAAGDTNTLTLLTNERLYQQSKINFIQAQATLLSDSVALFQALGGGCWNKSVR